MTPSAPGTPSSVTVDAHVHASTEWFEPVESLLYQLEAHSVDRAVLVQQSQTYDNSYLLESARNDSARLAAVVTIDEADPDCVQHLDSLVAAGAAGIRLSPRTGRDSGNSLQLWQRAEKLRLPVSCLGSSEEFASSEFARIVQQVPELTIILEHLGERQKRSPSYSPEMAAEVFKLAKYPNVLVKFHGLGEFAERARPQRSDPFTRPVKPLLEMAFDAFGAKRMMWGSDFPPVSTREGYRLAKTLPAHLLEAYGASKEDLSHAFGGVAQRVFWGERLS